MALLRGGLSDSLHIVFWGVAVLGVVTLLAAWRIPALTRDKAAGGGAVR